jgi:hypothetical protein
MRYLLIILMLFLGGFTTLNAQCNYTLRMDDSYGDGWNDNTMDLLINGALVLNDVTVSAFDNGGDFKEIQFVVNTGDEITTIWNGGGGWPEETSYIIFDSEGINVGSASQIDITTPIVVNCPVCERPTNLNVSNITLSTVDLSWTEEGTATLWEIEKNNPPYISTASNPTTISGLSPASDYEFRVRSDCGGGVESAWSDILSFTSPDTCGASENFLYTNNSTLESSVKNYIVSTPGDYISINVTEGATEVDYDYWYITDRLNGQGNLLASGTGVIPVDTYLSTTGEISFYITSDGSVIGSRIKFNVSCTTPSCSRPENLVSSNVTASSVTIDWTEASTATSWEYIIQPIGTAAPISTDTGTAVASKPFTATGLSEGVAYDLYLRADCGGGDTSIWSLPIRVITLANCGFSGTYDYQNNSTLQNSVHGFIASTPGQYIELEFTAGSTQLYFDYWYINDAADGSGNTIDSGYGSVVGTYLSETGEISFYVQSDETTTGNTLNFTTRCVCPPPTNITVSDIKVDGAKLSWDSNGPATSWEYVVQPQGTGVPTGTGVPNASTTLLLSGLSPNTDYEVYLRSDCGSSVIGSWVGPVNFTTLQTCGAAGSFTYQDNSTKASSLNGFAVSSAGDYIALDFSAGFVEFGNDFWYINDAADGSGNTIASGTGSIVGTYESVTGEISFYVISNDTALGTTFTYNISCSPPPTCQAPYGLSINTITGSGATLNWTELGTATNWEYVVQTAGTGIPAGSGVASSSKPIVISGLTSNSSYEIYLRSDCGGIFSDWSSPINFVTLGSCGDTGVFDYSNNSTLENSLRGFKASNPGDYIQLEFTAGETEIDWDSWYITDAADGLGNIIASGDGSIVGNYESITGEISIYIISDVIVSTLSAGFESFDYEVTCSPPPVCPYPTGLLTTNVTTTSVEIDWTEMGTATNWEYVRQPAGSPIPTGSGTPISSKPLVINGLSEGNTYEVYLRSDCGAQQSAWSTPLVFRTLASCGYSNTYTYTHNSTLNSSLHGFKVTTLGNYITLNFNAGSIASNDTFYITDASDGTGNILYSTSGSPVSDSYESTTGEISFYVISDNLLLGNTFNYSVSCSDGSVVTWNFGVWSNIVGPNAGLDAVVKDNLNVTTDLETNNLTLDAGETMTIAKGSTLHISSDFDNNGHLILDSDSDEYASLIFDGNVSGSGLLSYNRYTSVIGTNDLISSPVSGETVGNFASNNPTLATSGNLIALATHNNVTNGYNNYNVMNDAATVLTSGKGYRAATTDGSTLTFTGSIPNSDFDITLSKSTAANGSWNLIGNPYPAHISLADFLAVNSGLFDTNFSGIYGYDGNASDGWTVWNMAYSDANPDALITPGQGFFVATKDDGNVLSFNRSMFAIGTSDDFIQGRYLRPHRGNLSLQLSNVSKTYHTDIYFNTNASKSLDSGYDSGPIFNTTGQGIYSTLADLSTAQPLGIQSIHPDDIFDVQIPLGINIPSNTAFELSLSDANLPVTAFVYLFDSLNNSYVNLSENPYTLLSSTGYSGSDRFRLLFSASTLSIDDFNQNSFLKAYVNQKTLYVKGVEDANSEVQIFDLMGRQISKYKLQYGDNYFNLSHLNFGVYILKIKTTNQDVSQKFILK